MKQVFKCDYCKKMDTEDVIKKHEKECKYNPKNRRCWSCKYGEIHGYSTTCQLDSYPEDYPYDGPKSTRETCDSYTTGRPYLFPDANYEGE